MFIFFVFDQKCPLGANLVQKVKIISLGWNLVPTLIRICKFQWWCSLFSFPIRNALCFENLVQNVKIVSLRVNLLARLIQMCRFQWCCSFVLFWTGNTFGPKNQNYQFKLKFGTYTNSNMQNSMVIFTFSVFDRKYSFWANLVQKVKIISLSWNLLSRLIPICRIP